MERRRLWSARWRTWNPCGGIEIDPVEIAKRLIRTRSISGYESRLAGEIEEMLKPLHVEHQRVGDLGFNIIAEHRGKKDAPTVILNGHMDTVDVVEGWTKDPFSADIEDGRLYGLGSADMKGGLAALIYAFKKAVSENSPLNIIFTAVVREELDSEGAFALLNEMDGDVAFIAEPTNEMPMLGARGRYVLDIVFKGESGHGARPESGTNAILCASRFISEMQFHFKEHPKMGAGSACVLKIEGGSDFLSVPDTCKVVLDRHVVPGEDRDSVMQELLEMLENADMDCDAEVSWHSRSTPFLEPYEWDIENDMVRDFASLYIERYGELKPIYGQSVGDFNAFGKRMPTVVYGPKGANWHATDEYVMVDSVKNVAEFYADLLRKMGERV